MKCRIEDREASRVVGWELVTTRHHGRNFQDIPQFWERCRLEGKLDALSSLTATGILGLCCEWDAERERFTYLIGVESADAPDLPAGARSLSLASARYAVFESVGAMPHAVQEATMRAYAEWFPGSDFEHAGTADFELYPSFPRGDPRGDPSSHEHYCEVWIPLAPRKS